MQTMILRLRTMSTNPKKWIVCPSMLNPNCKICDLRFLRGLWFFECVRQQVCLDGEFVGALQVAVCIGGFDLLHELLICSIVSCSSLVSCRPYSF